MVRVKNLVSFVALSSVMFGAGATVATVALSYLPMVNASSTHIAQGLKQSKDEEVDEENNLKFRFQDCKRGGKTITCNILVTNLYKDTQTVLVFSNWNTGYNSRIVDVSGNEYIAKLVKVGQKEAKQEMDIQFIKGVPTKISFSFEIPPEVTNLAAIEIQYRTNISGLQYGKTNFRDITIGASQASNPTNHEKCVCPPQTNQKKPRGR